MHEFSIAQNICKKILKVAENEGATSIEKIKIKIGIFTHINKNQLIFCIESIAESKEILEDVKIKVKKGAAKIRCKCGNFWEVDASKDGNMIDNTRFLKCPKCNSRDVDITGGKCVTLESVEVEV